MKAGDLNRFLAELTSFTREVVPHPPPGLDWEELADVAELQGLAGIVSYQLDYRFLARVRPPPWLRERLLMTFNGQVNDNLLKITHLRRVLSEEGIPPVMLLGGVALGDSFYPHIAFRPLPEIDLWVQGPHLAQFGAAIAEAGLPSYPVGERRDQRSVAARFANPDIDLQVWLRPPGFPLAPIVATPLWDRSLAAPVFGPAAHRLDPADSVCALIAALALEGFAVPRVLLIDLREMLHRADTQEGFYAPKGIALRWAEVEERARALGLVRSLWAGLRLVGELFPEVSAKATRLEPRLPATVRALIDEAVVRPARDPHRTTVVRAAQTLRRILLR
jgi:hypothetical protein